VAYGPFIVADVQLAPKIGASDFPLFLGAPKMTKFVQAVVRLP
jgi:hypothetical protein